MAYKQPDEVTIQKIRAKHLEEKSILSDMELTAAYKQNNPVLNRQREVVRKLYDQTLMYDAFLQYPKMKRDFCMFMAIPECQGEIKNTFNHWWMYGNCCAVCNAHFGKASAVLFSVKEPIENDYENTVYTLPPDIEEDVDAVFKLSTLSAFEDEELELS